MAQPKTYLLTKYEQYLINNHEYQMIVHDQLLKGFLANVVIPRLGIDLEKNQVTWNTAKGELYCQETPQDGGKDEPKASPDQPSKDVGKQSKGSKKS